MLRKGKNKRNWNIRHQVAYCALPMKTNLPNNKTHFWPIIRPHLFAPTGVINKQQESLRIGLHYKMFYFIRCGNLRGGLKVSAFRKGKGWLFFSTPFQLLSQASQHLLWKFRTVNLEQLTSLIVSDGSKFGTSVLAARWGHSAITFSTWHNFGNTTWSCTSGHGCNLEVNSKLRLTQIKMPGHPRRRFNLPSTVWRVWIFVSILKFHLPTGFSSCQKTRIAYDPDHRKTMIKCATKEWMESQAKSNPG